MVSKQSCTKYCWRGVLILSSVLLAACSSRGRLPDDAGMSGDGGTGADAATECGPGVEVVCRGTTEITCSPDGGMAGSRNCADEDMRCVSGMGCATCQPGETTCKGGDVHVCKDDASGFELDTTCDLEAGESCASGSCKDLCAEAKANDSYIGCDYWPVVTINRSAPSEFTFAVVVANPQQVEANVTVERGGSEEASTTVPAGGLETIELPWVEDLKGPAGSRDAQSSLLTDGAYHLTSSVPVTVYQFNPLNYRIDQDCSMEPPGGGGDGQCFSYTNDASLLLPSHVLTGNYIAMSRASLYEKRELCILDSCESTSGGNPGFTTVVGVENTSVEVRATGYVAASGDGAVNDMAPGDTKTFMLEQGDVLQLVGQMPNDCPEDSPSDERSEGGATLTTTHCEVGEDYDLTGTEIQADGKVAVVSGHSCTYVPFDEPACDHLEEQMFPLEAWGDEFVLGASEPLRDEPNVVRVVSGKDGNAVSFQPSDVHSEVMLDRGEMVEFETKRDFRVTGSGAVMMAQFLVGQNYGGMTEREANGDPSMSLAIPTEQYRTDYTFLTPDTFEVGYVNVIATGNAQTVMLDDSKVMGWRSLGGTGVRTARVEIPNGTHEITSEQPFGVVVYGFGSYTSYMYPGGLDLEMINAPF